MLKTLIKTGILAKCPGCESRSIFEGFLEVPVSCSACDLVYQTSDGAWLGAPVIGYGFGVLFAASVFWLEYIASPIKSVGLDPMWTIPVLSVALMIPGYRPSKSIWFALLYVYGFMDQSEK